MVDRSLWRDVVFEQLGEGLVVQSSDGTIIDCNPAAERILGFSWDVMAGHTSAQLQWRALRADGSDYPFDERPAMVALATGEAVRDEVMGFTGPDGEISWIIVSSEPLPQVPGSEAAVVSTFTDVTDARNRIVERLRVTVDSMLDPHLLLRTVKDTSGHVTDVWVAQANEAAADFLGIPRDEFVGARLLEALPDAQAEQIITWVARVVEDAVPLMLQEAPLPMPEGPDRLVDVRAVQLHQHVSFTWRDVTERVRGAQELAASEELFRTAMRTAISGMALTDLEGNFQVVNEALCTTLKREESAMRTTSLVSLVDEGFRPAVTEQIQLVAKGVQSRSVLEVQAITPDAGTVWLQVGIASIRLPSGHRAALLIQVEDITGERLAREELAYQAFHDPLTGLHNRARVMEMLERELRVARREGDAVGVLFLDLDNFKVVNDSLGHAAGDQVITTVAGRIQNVLRPREVAGRFGGDEFVVVVSDVKDQKDVAKVAERLSSSISHEIAVLSHRIVPTVSVGVALSNSESTPESLLRSADAALFRAKDEGKSRWHIFDEAMHAQAVQRMTLESQMRHGLDAGQFTVHFQPVVDLRTGRISAHEALVRWEHPTRGRISAGDFVPVAEETGLIVPLGQRVTEEVARIMSGKPESFGPVSINVSAVQLASLGWAQRFLDTLNDYSVHPRRIVVEVTETAVLSMLERASDDLNLVRAQGGGVFVDDFGTGFSSISLLRELPVTGLKLDKSFVRDLTPFDSPSNALAAGLAGLARGLELMAVAEGVETEEEASLLAAQGWTHGQGYLFGRPEPVG